MIDWRAGPVRVRYRRDRRAQGSLKGPVIFRFHGCSASDWERHESCGECGACGARPKPESVPDRAGAQFDAKERPKDTVLEIEDVRIFIDPKSLIYLKGMTLDYKETLMQSGFAFDNPNAKGTCGCGVSFSV